MTVALALILIATVSALIAAPLVADSELRIAISANFRDESLEREKNAALNAIREAQFDHAMGKLSEEDFTSLRSFYERRALTAMTEIGARLAATEASACMACGRVFIDDSVFCGGCGRPRAV